MGTLQAWRAGLLLFKHLSQIDGVSEFRLKLQVANGEAKGREVNAQRARFAGHPK